MTLTQQMLTIGAVILGTMCTRFFPFICFPEHKTPPKWIRYLGKVLPPAIMGFLVVYCLRNMNGSSFSLPPYGLPEIGSLLLLSGSYFWKKNALFSILLGTACYMILIRIC